jgi:SAM-dependent methyltransferase
MPDLQWNRAVWDGTYDWRSEGEEWSERWGGSEAQWFGSLYPRLHRFLPARRILEIAPGFGRWTRYLLPSCEAYLGIDLSARAVAACQRSFAGVPRARFVQNDGLSLDAAPAGRFDFIFSFDSLVHVELQVLAAYLPQLLAKLAPGGVAFVHHSNFAALPPGLANPHHRAGTVAAAPVAETLTGAGGVVLVQEVVNWGGPDLIDCLTLFARAADYPGQTPLQMTNPDWGQEMDLIRERQSPYARLPVSPHRPGGGARGRLARRLGQGLIQLGRRLGGGG